MCRQFISLKSCAGSLHHQRVVQAFYIIKELCGQFISLKSCVGSLHNFKSCAGRLYYERGNTLKERHSLHCMKWMECCCFYFCCFCCVGGSVLLIFFSYNYLLYDLSMEVRMHANVMDSLIPYERKINQEK